MSRFSRFTMMSVVGVVMSRFSRFTMMSVVGVVMSRFSRFTMMSVDSYCWATLETGELSRLVARDAYLDSLVRVLERGAMSIDEAYTIAARHDTYVDATGATTSVSDRTPSYEVRAVGPSTKTHQPSSFDYRLSALERAVSSLTGELQSGHFAFCVATVECTSVAVVWSVPADYTAARTSLLRMLVARSSPSTVPAKNNFYRKAGVEWNFRRQYDVTEQQHRPHHISQLNWAASGSDH